MREFLVTMAFIAAAVAILVASILSDKVAIFVCLSLLLAVLYEAYCFYFPGNRQ